MKAVLAAALAVLTVAVGPNPVGIASAGPLPAQSAANDPRFGAVEAFWDPQAAVEARVGWERILFYWSQLQPAGPDDWNTLHVPDEWLQAAQSQGREVVGVLKNTPLWAVDSDLSSEADPPRGLDLPIDDPANLWAGFVRRAVEHFGPRGVHRWIIWNEPDIKPGVYGQEWAGTVDAYYRLLKVAYQVIKQQDQAAQVHLAGLTYWHDRDWLRSFMAVAVADPEGAENGFFFDVVSLHIYFQTDTVDFIVNEARAALAAYGLHKPIWINETNASPDTDPQWPVERARWRVDLREQASFILQAFALALSAGVERVAVYKLIDAGLPAGGEPFGLLRPDHSRRPAFAAYQVATRYYAGTRAARLVREPLWEQVTLEQGDRTTRIFWARTGSAVNLQVPRLADHAILVDQEGQELQLEASGGAYSLELPGARCADQVLGCIIGGPTFLLVEEAIGAPQPASMIQAQLSTPQAIPTTQAEGEAADATATPSPAAHTPESTPTSEPTMYPSPTRTRMPPTSTPWTPAVSPASPTAVASATSPPDAGATPQVTRLELTATAATPMTSPTAGRAGSDARVPAGAIWSAAGAVVLLLGSLIGLMLRKRRP